jgi:hypothetical protein
VERELEALLQLLGQQAPFAARRAQPLGDVLPVAVGSEERIPFRHTISLARPMPIDKRLAGVRPVLRDGAHRRLCRLAFA